MGVAKAIIITFILYTFLLYPFLGLISASGGINIFTFTGYFIPLLFFEFLAVGISLATNKKRIIEIRVRNLPVRNWIAIIESKTLAFNTDVARLEIKGSPLAIFCPQIVDNMVYFPRPAKTKLSGNVIEINYQPTTAYSVLLDFPLCMKFYNPIYTNPNIPRTHIVAEKEIVDKNGKKQRLRIEFNKPGTYPTPTQPPIGQNQLPINLSLSNWDPNVWVGREIHGYKVDSVIGTGGNGYVLKVSLGGTKYAMKVLSITPTKSGTVTLQAKSGFDQLFNESENLKRLSQNPNFVTIFGIYVDSNMIMEALKGNAEAYFKNPPAIVMEFMEGGSADKLLTNQNITYSTYWPLIVKKIIKQVAVALSYLHSSGYVHLDIKPQNIFLKRNPGYLGEEVYRNIDGIIKLGDLGSAVKIGGKIEQVTPSYAPPEHVEAIITGKGADPKMDIFALGMTAYVMLTLQHDNPAGDYLDKVLDAYINGNISVALTLVRQAKQILSTWRPTIPLTTPQELQQVIIKTLNPEPQLRPTAQEIANTL
ncbi:hypothetical protein SJAV_27450 [Sulfurisphaera javensis]|uniref:non-specific serine/threonine protein kinase n=1 Tax=Sulfurisphaera javensis TaxID=2049879 RepID=A0AAT9GVP2_9CREN